jgi:hypothetical protein
VATGDGLLVPGSGIAEEQISRLRAAATKTDLAGMRPRERRARAEATADALLSYVELHSDGPNLAVLAQELATFRERVTAKMLANPAYFETQAFLTRANARIERENQARAEAEKLPPYKIERPSDVADFMLRDILMSPVRERSTVELPQVLEAVGYAADERDRTLATIGQVMDKLLTEAALVIFMNPSLPDGQGGEVFAVDAAVEAMETRPEGF